MVIFRGLRAVRAGSPAIRHMRLATLLLAACATLATASVAVAQRPATARRLSTTIGVSKGAGALTCPFCSGEGKGGLAGVVGVELPFRTGLRFGLEGEWWLHSGGGSTRSVLAAVPVVHFYPAASGPLFFKLGLGVARFSASSDEEELRSTSLSGLVGVGYEFRLSSRSALIPYVSWLNGNRGTMRLNGALVTDLGGVSLLQYGLALSKR